MKWENKYIWISKEASLIVFFFFFGLQKAVEKKKELKQVLHEDCSPHNWHNLDFLTHSAASRPAFARPLPLCPHEQF